MSSFDAVNYTTNNGLFQALGSTTDYTNGSVSLLGFGNYTLTATITTAGVLTAGSLTIQGDVGAGVETLLTGTLNTGASGTAFGYNNGGGNIFEFLFTVTGGKPVIVSDFGGSNAPNRGVILTAFFQNGGTPFSGSWLSNFENDGSSGVSDNFVIPEPSSILLVLFGGALSAFAYRATAKRHAYCPS